MVGDGTTGELGADDTSSGPESEAGAPSSRGRRAAVVGAVGERADALPPSSSGARLALERDLHRFQAASRHGRVQRNAKRAKAGDKAPAPSESSPRTQPASAAVRTRVMTTAKAVPPSRFSPDDEGPRSLRGTAADLGPRSFGAGSVDAGARDESAAWDAATGNAATGNAAIRDTAIQDTAVQDSATWSTATRDGVPSETIEPADGEGTVLPEEAATTTPKRKKRRKPAKRGFETQLTLAVIEERFAADLAAFAARGGVVPAPPPLPYRPIHYAEAFALTADERRALPKGEILRPIGNVGKMVAEALAAVPLLDRMRVFIAALPVDVGRVERIATYARALSHSDALLAAALEVTLPAFASPGETTALTRTQRLQRLTALGLAARGRLHAELQGLIKLGYLPAGALSGLKGGRGHSNVAVDLLALLEVRLRAIAAGAHSNIAADDIRNYNTLAGTLIDTSAKAAAKGITTARDLAIEERARAYTLLWLAYREAQHALQFIFRDQLAVKAVLPTLLVGRGRKAKG